LLYNSHTGQFINGITGRTPGGQKPADVLDLIHTQKMPWRQWCGEHPQTLVLSIPQFAQTNAPTRPILPAYPIPKMAIDPSAQTIVAFIGDANPVALQSDTIAKQPLNLDVDSVPVFVVRGSADAPAVAFDRRLPDDLRPRFDLAIGRRPAARCSSTATPIRIGLHRERGWPVSKS
jgi:hypothetical protein